MANEIKNLQEKSLHVPSPSNIIYQALHKSTKTKKPTKLFSNIHVPICDEKIFPPIITSTNLLVAKLPDANIGPAPVEFGIQLQPHKLPTSTSLNSLWLSACVTNDDKRLNEFKNQNIDVFGANVELQKLVLSLKKDRDAVAMQSMSKIEASNHILKYNPLHIENKKLVANAKQRRQKKYIKSNGNSTIHSSILDRLAQLSRLETQAAIVCQRWWRRILQIRFWKRYALETKTVVYLQQIWRSILESRRLKKLLTCGRTIAKVSQSWWRGLNVRRQYASELLLINGAALDIQRVARGFFARKYTLSLRKKYAAIKIQALWRGTVDRGKQDFKFLNNTIKKIQALVRRYLARLHYKTLFDRYNNAAIILQAIARGWLARRYIGTLLLKKEENIRKNYMEYLNTLLDTANHRIQVLKADSVTKIVSNIPIYQKEWDSVTEAVEAKEAIFLSAERDALGAHELEKLSANIVAEPMKIALKAYKNARIQLTEAKANAIFQTALKLREAKIVEERYNTELKNASITLNQLQQQIKFTKEDTYIRSNYLKQISDKFIAARKIGEERRRWAYSPININGKPDIQQRKNIQKLTFNRKEKQQNKQEIDFHDEQSKHNSLNVGLFTIFSSEEMNELNELQQQIFSLDSLTSSIQNAYEKYKKQTSVDNMQIDKERIQEKIESLNDTTHDAMFVRLRSLLPASLVKNLDNEIYKNHSSNSTFTDDIDFEENIDVKNLYGPNKLKDFDEITSSDFLYQVKECIQVGKEKEIQFIQSLQKCKDSIFPNDINRNEKKETNKNDLKKYMQEKEDNPTKINNSTSLSNKVSNLFESIHAINKQADYLRYQEILDPFMQSVTNLTSNVIKTTKQKEENERIFKLLEEKEYATRLIFQELTQRMDKQHIIQKEDKTSYEEIPLPNHDIETIVNVPSSNLDTLENDFFLQISSIK